MSNFHPLEVIGRETQFHVGEMLYVIININHNHRNYYLKY